MAIETILTVSQIKQKYLDIPPTWKCPITGLIVPQDVLKNLEYRKQLLTSAEEDISFRQELYTASSKSLVWWINTFCWTLRTKIIDEEGNTRQVSSKDAHQPFILWPVQVEYVLEIEKAITEGYDFLTDKSRDMGATWLHLAAFYHKWLFESDRSFLMLSAKEDYVDSPGQKGVDKLADPSTLFGKLDYINYWLPDWMKPSMSRIKLHLTNLTNNSRIDGESTTATAGSSERRTAVFLDEAAKMPEADSIKQSTRDVTACRLVNSTHFGPGTTYAKWLYSGSIKVSVLDWSYHPEKAKGLYAIKDEATGIIKLRSPWYDKEAKIRSPKEMAIEIDRNPIGSGDTFFERSVLVAHRRQFVKPPKLSRYHITFNRDVALSRIPEIVRRNLIDTVEIHRTSESPWIFWEDLVDGRPDQNYNYVFAIDVGKGMGASNSIISVGCLETKKKIAEWASANFAPHDFAQIAVASALWFGGANRGHRPLFIWEANGDPGIYFGRTLIKDIRYPSVYFDKAVATKIREGKPRHYGWHSSQDKKAELLGDYRRSLSHSLFQNPSEMALNEAEVYVYFEGGQIGPAYLQNESEAARKTHGDRVIADALLNLAFGLTGKRLPKESEPSKMSFASRYREWQRNEKERREGKTWDYRRYA